MFAVIKSGGRQYKVSVGEKLEVNRLPIEAGQQVEFEEVLLISDADNSMVGAPFVENAKVVATVDAQARGKKVIIFKYKSKKRVRHRRGHRQEITLLTIDDILANGKSLITGEAPKAEKAPAAKSESAAPVAEVQETITPAEEAAAPEVEKKPRRRRTTKKADEAASSTEE